VRVLVWIAVGLFVGMIYSLLRERKLSAQIFPVLLTSITGALVGGLISRVVIVTADAGSNGQTAAALVGAIVALALRATLPITKRPERTV
jgi:uncharacterized membrane protein YeaQ/YmgE (transglycosylase-associated protein family)